MSDIAYVSVITDSAFAIGLAHRGLRGYTPLPAHGTFESWDAAKDYAKGLNTAELGLDWSEALNIIASTMRP